MNLRGIRFSSMCENRDVPLSLLLPLRLYEMKEAYEIDLIGCPDWLKSLVLWIIIGAK